MISRVLIKWLRTFYKLHPYLMKEKSLGCLPIATKRWSG